MEIDTQLYSLHVLEALASESRLNIINLLAQDEYNIKQIAEKLYLSSGIVTRHIRQLEKAGLIETQFKSTAFGKQKICRLKIDEIHIRFPGAIFPEYKYHQANIPVGHFTDYSATPTCGLATYDDYVGELDQPMYFMDTKRMEAEIVWLTKGYLEYKIPNYLILSHQKAELLEIVLEISSEFPVSNNNWPSKVGFHVNNTYIGHWIVPGNYSDVRGKLNPAWWPSRNSQYGLLKTLRVTPHESLVDGEAISNVTLNDIDLNQSLMTIRLSVEDNDFGGGLTIFGKQFGNYPLDIQYKMYYSEVV